MAKIVGASKARAQLSKLMDEVTNGRDNVVVIRRRGTAEGTALVREGYLRYLEARVRAEDAKARKKPFKLIGSMTVHGDVEEIIRENRAEQARLFDKKFEDL